jgi:16S rRNA (uracil1498-N3)-methyltransferase
MARYEFRLQRLYATVDLQKGAEFVASPAQANYLLNVLRLKAGDGVLLFNGRDGEWRSTIANAGRRTCRLVLEEQTREQERGPDLIYLFAPLKRARLDYMVEKAVELGAARLCPVLTRHTQAERVNLERMRAHVVEAAEQCGILRLPEVYAPQRLDTVLDGWDDSRKLVFCDEAAEPASPIEALRSAIEPGGPVAVLIGPEGGFSTEERTRLLALPGVVRLALGPRIMRADTAAVAALALVNAAVGDWR